jgi:anhydro-N-acetylmuramic acid kinase
LLKLPSDSADLESIEQEVTDAHIRAVLEFCHERETDLASIDCIGFHGQTIKHEPHLARTWQLGDGAYMANALGCVVINRFRDADMRNGGQGAPLAPAYHRALVEADQLPCPAAILNIGGVSNITLVTQDELHALDCGPGNALLDDWVNAQAGVPFDRDGALSSGGQVDQKALEQLLDHPFFKIRGVKSLDRNHFSPQPVRELSLADGAATLVAFTTHAIAIAAQSLPSRPCQWIVTGGGRLNRTLIGMLRAELSAPVLVAEDFGWAGDAIEAHAFAYLAVRSLRNLPFSWPTTTGVRQPTSGGAVHRPVIR